MRTVFARGPLGLDSISKETFSPPCSLSKLPSVELRWKKYSLPSSAAMKPKPRSETIFLMVPSGINLLLVPRTDLTDGSVRETERRPRPAPLTSSGGYSIPDETGHREAKTTRLFALG